MERPTVADAFILECLDQVRDKLRAALVKKGPGAFASTHEAYGVIAEEMHELLVELRSASRTDFYGELQDVACACVFAMASQKQHIQNGTQRDYFSR